MKYFVPVLSLNKSAQSIEKLGGTPFGLNSERHPKCGYCGKPQSLIAQFVHHADRLDLGRSGRALYVFQCEHDPGICEAWDHNSGANTCFVIEPEDLELVEIEKPSEGIPKRSWFSKIRSTKRSSREPVEDPSLINEVFVADWIEKDDDVDPSTFDNFFNDNTYYELFKANKDKLNWGSRLGSVPTWIQSSEEGPKDGWRFVGQLTEIYSLVLANERPPQWAHADKSKRPDRTHYASGPNFGGGLAYLFLKLNDENVPSVKMFWQC